MSATKFDDYNKLFPPSLISPKFHKITIQMCRSLYSSNSCIIGADLCMHFKRNFQNLLKFYLRLFLLTKSSQRILNYESMSIYVTKRLLPWKLEDGSKVSTVKS